MFIISITIQPYNLKTSQPNTTLLNHFVKKFRRKNYEQF